MTAIQNRAPDVEAPRAADAAFEYPAAPGGGATAHIVDMEPVVDAAWVTGYGLQLCRYGPVVVFYGYLRVPVGQGGSGLYLTLGLVPEGYRPDHDASVSVALVGTSQVFNMSIGVQGIDDAPAGTIYLSGTAADSNLINFSLTWITTEAEPA